MSLNKCAFCDKEVLESHNYCDWKCMVGLAKATGGRVINPNGLEPSCIMHDGTMLEIEHGDHPDYKHPVEVKWIGAPDEGYRNIFIKNRTDDQVREMMGSYQALIYTDGTIAVTLYECEYFAWYVRSGKPMNPKPWQEDYRLVSLELPERFKKVVEQA